MEAKERIGTWFIWGVILLSWIELFLVLALTFRASGCNHSSEAGTQSMDIVAESVGFEARSKNGPLQPVQQSSLSSQPVSSFGSKRRDRPMVTGPGLPPTGFVTRRAASQSYVKPLYGKKEYEIRQRALEIHVERGGDGSDLENYLDDWLQAERELQGKYNKSSRE